MKKSPSLLALASLLLGACQSNRHAEPATALRPEPPKPLPAWVSAPTSGQSDRQVKIESKMIEITRPADGTELGAKPYRRHLNEAEKQLLLRKLAVQKGTDLMTTPSVVTREGQPAKVEIIREFIYPTEPGDGAPTATENVGVTAHFRAKPRQGDAVALDAVVDVSEFQGFAKVSPDFEQPVFNRRRAEFSGTIQPGDSVLLGGLYRTDQQDFEDTRLGIFKKRGTQELTRELVVLLTPTRVRSDGKAEVASAE